MVAEKSSAFMAGGLSMPAAFRRQRREYIAKVPLPRGPVAYCRGSAPTRWSPHADCPYYVACRRLRAGRARVHFRHRADHGRPAPPVRNVTDTYFGVTVNDPYRYFEDLKNPEVAAWMKGEAAYTTSVLAKIPGRDGLLKEIQVRGDAVSARINSVQVVGPKVYYEKRLATDNIFKLYVREGFEGKERLLVDPDAVQSANGEHSAIDYYAPSPDNKFVAYGISTGGSEQSVIHIIDMATGKELPDRIDRANYANPSWLPDGRLVYSRLQKMAEGAPVTEKYRFQRVYIHKLGDNPDNDASAARCRRFAAGDPRARGKHLRRQPAGDVACAGTGDQRCAARNADLGGAAFRAERRQDPLGQGGRYG